MVIVHVLSSFHTGGQERVAVSLAEGQVAAGHRVLAVSLAEPPDGPEAEHFRASGAETLTLAKRHRGFDAGLVLRLARMFSERNATLVHTHNPQPLIYGAPAARLSGVALVHTKHGANPDLLRRRWLRQIAGHLADAYVAVSPATAEIAARGHECAKRRLLVIENGVDVERFRRDAAARRELRAELGIPETAWVTGTVGRLAPEKDHVLLLDAIAPCLGDRHRLVIVGAGPEAARLRVHVSGMSAARWVHLTGARDDVARLLSAFDVFVLSSKTEGLPLVIPEAMAASLPVVSTAVGGIASVVRDGETGLLVVPRDVGGLRDALARLESDRIRARELGRAGRRLAELCYSKQRMLGNYLELYRTCTNGGRA